MFIVMHLCLLLENGANNEELEASLGNMPRSRIHMGLPAAPYPSEHAGLPQIHRPPSIIWRRMRRMSASHITRSRRELRSARVLLIAANTLGGIIGCLLVSGISMLCYQIQNVEVLSASETTRLGSYRVSRLTTCSSSQVESRETAGTEPPSSLPAVFSNLLRCSGNVRRQKACSISISVS